MPKRHLTAWARGCVAMARRRVFTRRWTWWGSSTLRFRA